MLSYLLRHRKVYLNLAINLKVTMSTSMVRSFVPAMTADMHKGQCGRIGVVGGCKEYTGAPYFAAIAALKVGCDISHVFCTADAAPVIKSYSPELIVHPILDSDCYLEDFDEWLARLHCLVVGPGLGRDASLMLRVMKMIGKAKERHIPIIIDADGLFLVTLNPSIIRNTTNVILTPNAIEFSRLFQAVMGHEPDQENDCDIRILCCELGSLTIVRKGEVDLISNGAKTLKCTEKGSSRRCGGQGDLLSGSMASFLHWACLAKNNSSSEFKDYGPYMSAAFGACVLTRACNHRAYQQYSRSMTTSDMIQQIHPVFDELFEISNNK